MFSNTPPSDQFHILKVTPKGHSDHIPHDILEISWVWNNTNEYTQSWFNKQFSISITVLTNKDIKETN